MEGQSPQHPDGAIVPTSPDGARRGQLTFQVTLEARNAKRLFDLAARFDRSEDERGDPPLHIPLEAILLHAIGRGLSQLAEDVGLRRYSGPKPWEAKDGSACSQCAWLNQTAEERRKSQQA